MMSNMPMAPNFPHPIEEPNQDMMTEVLNISKIKEGFYIGDKISAISIDVIIQFKITHMINATGNQIMNQWESIGISYLTLNWSEVPNQILFDSKDEIANKIVDFIDGSLLGKGEGLLAHSNKGQNRVCIVVLIYLMKKYKWSLIKSMQFLKSKKQDVEIPDYFMIQVKNFENRLIQRGELTHDIPWEFAGLTDPEEKLLRNTYMNGLPVPKNNNLNNNNMKMNVRHIMWADTNPYKQMPIEVHDVSNDLLLQNNIRPVFVHQTLRPKKGCIKGNNNNSFQNKNNSMMMNNMGNVNINSLNNNNYMSNNYFNNKSVNNNYMPENDNINLIPTGKFNNNPNINNPNINNQNKNNMFNAQQLSNNKNLISNDNNNLINPSESNDKNNKSYSYEGINDSSNKKITNNINVINENNQKNIFNQLNNPNNKDMNNLNIINNINRMNNDNLQKPLNNQNDNYMMPKKQEKNNNIPNMNNFLMNDENKIQNNIDQNKPNMNIKNNKIPQYSNNNQNLFNSSPNFVGNNMQKNMELTQMQNQNKMMNNSAANNFNNYNNFNKNINIINNQNDKRFNKALEYSNNNLNNNNNFMNYTPIVQGPYSNNINNQNQNKPNKIPTGKPKNDIPISNYNPVRRGGRPMSGGVNNFNSNNKKQIPYNMNNNITNNISAVNKPINNFNPSLIRRKGTPQAGTSLLNRNQSGGPVKIKNSNYINNNINNYGNNYNPKLTKKPNTPDLNRYNSTGMNNDNRMNKYNTNNNNRFNPTANSTMTNGFGYNNNYSRKMGGTLQRPSTAPHKDKDKNNVKNATANNFYSGYDGNKRNNIKKPMQRPNSAGGKNSKNFNNLNSNKNVKKNGYGINKRLPSPQINSNNMGNNMKGIHTKPRGVSPMVKSSNFSKRPPLPNSTGSRIYTNKSANIKY